ncbi:hypothetical protein V6N11_031535 [Hibiscus sabdariffa]|uniref:Zinc finger ZPR1-type domain-containing protein n=1 Tax=Hibiscus sabdariffa TaxID=183260 RepID=A0ABR2SY45_9ROSI
MESDKEKIADDVGSVVEAISADDDNAAPLYVVESLCMRCTHNVLLSAFECPHCGERNNEVQFAGEIQPKGCHYRLEVQSGDPKVEGILVRAIDGLQALQEERKKADPQTAEAIDQFLLKLKACATGESPFTFILDDPAGNSFIENPFAPSPDPSLSIRFYDRTPEQQASLGYLVQPSQLNEHVAEASMGETNNDVDQIRGQPHGSVGAAAGQKAIAQSNSAEIAEALFRYSAPEELKPGGPIPEKGKRITLFVKNINDLSRDVIKSDTASVKVPELELELASGTLGGIVTTVEGLITKISESLERVHGFTFGDSLDESKKNKWRDFKASLNKILSMTEPWTLILDDALANSFIAPATDDIKDDHQLIFEEYERSWEQNEELGLNDIDTSSADAAYGENTRV